MNFLLWKCTSGTVTTSVLFWLSCDWRMCIRAVLLLLQWPYTLSVSKQSFASWGAGGGWLILSSQSEATGVFGQVVLWSLGPGVLVHVWTEVTGAGLCVYVYVHGHAQAMRYDVPLGSSRTDEAADLCVLPMSSWRWREQPWWTLSLADPAYPHDVSLTALSLHLQDHYHFIFSHLFTS